MKTIVLIPLILFSYSLFAQEQKKEKKKDEIKVFICNSMTSDKYHYKKECKGLTRCNDTIKKISLRKAKNVYGRNVCGYETHIESSGKYEN
ncbi:hypothetical protein J8281_06730 [Aquimarina sp. U1-2]|uniref:hypothetical protein n=1 Tax=Aquimarina sp. U1-2 TaxID=2823141 RepID=UPI001AECEDDC|nr:hypothetical protein [Aquimarina sp. U1-2]MBP2831879.1 hypothetical protein [Aquimarina sp. U1-2]